MISNDADSLALRFSLRGPISFHPALSCPRHVVMNRFAASARGDTLYITTAVQYNSSSRHWSRSYLQWGGHR